MLRANPFNDPEFKKQILGKEGKGGDDSADYEILQDETVSSNLKNIISNKPILPKSAKNIILDASTISSNQKEEKALELTQKLNEVFTRYNKTYNTDLHVDFSSLSNTLVNVSDPKSRHILELFVSEVFQSIKPILILNMIQKLCLAIDYILDPKRLFDSSQMTTQDIFIAVSKIMEYIEFLEEMRKSVVIPGSDLELKKLAEDTDNEELSNPESKKVIDDFMKLFQRENGIKD